MERIEQYKKIIRAEFSNWGKLKNSDMPDVKNIFLEDVEHGSFILITMGWHNNVYIHNLLFHIEVKEDKVWIHEDSTGTGIANVFVENGIPKSHIILGFVEPFLRDNAELAKAS